MGTRLRAPRHLEWITAPRWQVASWAPELLLWCLLAGLFVSGRIDPGQDLLWQAPALSALLFADLHAIQRRFKGERRSERTQNNILDGLFALLTLRVGLTFLGVTAAAALSPLQYLLLAVIATTCSASTLQAVLAAALGLEVLPFFFGLRGGAVADSGGVLMLRCGLSVAFASLYQTLCRLDFLRVHASHQREEQRSRQDLETLYETACSLAQGLDNHAEAHHITAAATQLVSSDAVALALYRPDTAQFEVVSAEGTAFSGLRGAFIDARGVLHDSLTSRAHKRIETSWAQASDLPVLNELVALPLWYRRRPLGCLLMGSRRSISARDLCLLEALTEPLAASVAHSERFRQMEALANIDGLTGLLNRRAFSAQLNAARDRGGLLSLILCDIDHFKAVNDTHGHPMGDAVLREVSQTLRRTLRSADVVGRYGGEEFAVLLEGASQRAALETAERLREAIAALTFQPPGGLLRVTLSLGVASALPEDTDAEQLIKRADQALYRCKAEGRDCVRCWTPPEAH